MLTVIKADIYNLKKPVDAIVFRDRAAIDLVLRCSSYSGSKYSIILPETILNEDNAIAYMEYYERAINKAIELDFCSIAIQAVDLLDDDLTYSFIKELCANLGKWIKRNKLDITFVCNDTNLKQIYEYTIFGAVKLPQVEVISNLYFQDFIVIPTTKSIFKLDRKYKSLKRTEPKKVFLKCFSKSKLLKGEIAPIPYGENYYIFMNMIKLERKRDDNFGGYLLNGLQNTFKMMNTMCYKNVTLPIIHFSPNKKENNDLVRLVVEEAYKEAVESEINVKLYVPYAELISIVEEHLAELMGADENGATE